MISGVASPGIRVPSKWNRTLIVWLTAKATPATKLKPKGISTTGIRKYLVIQNRASALARADALFWITKYFLMPVVLIPFGFSFVAGVAFAVSQTIRVLFHFDGTLIPGEATPLIIVAFTVTMIVAYDLSYYLYHLAQHKVPILWELHKVHHSAE